MHVDGKWPVCAGGAVEIVGLVRPGTIGNHLRRADPLQGDGNQVQKCLQGAIGQHAAAKGEAADGLATEVDDGDVELRRFVEAVGADGYCVLEQECGIGDFTRSAYGDFAGVGVEDCDRFELINLCDMARQLRHHGFARFAEQDGPAQGIELLGFPLPAHGIEGLLADASGEVAGDQAGAEKRDEGDPVLRVGDGELSDGREKVIVEAEHRRDRGDGGEGEPPGGGDGQDADEVGEAGGGCVYVEDLEADGCGGGN